MSDYSRIDTETLEEWARIILNAYYKLGCPRHTECNDCCMREDCNSLLKIKSNLYAELFRRREA